MIVKIDETHNPSANSTSFPSSGTITFMNTGENQQPSRKSMPAGPFQFGGKGSDSQQPSQAAAFMNMNPYLNDLKAAAHATVHRVKSPSAKRSIAFDKLDDLIEDL